MGSEMCIRDRSLAMGVLLGIGWCVLVGGVLVVLFGEGDLEQEMLVALVGSWAEPEEGDENLISAPSQGQTMSSASLQELIQKLLVAEKNNDWRAVCDASTALLARNDLKDMDRILIKGYLADASAKIR